MIGELNGVGSDSLPMRQAVASNRIDDLMGEAADEIVAAGVSSSIASNVLTSYPVPLSNVAVVQSLTISREDILLTMFKLSRKSGGGSSDVSAQIATIAMVKLQMNNYQSLVEVNSSRLKVNSVRILKDTEDQIKAQKAAEDKQRRAEKSNRIKNAFLVIAAVAMIATGGALSAAVGGLSILMASNGIAAAKSGSGFLSEKAERGLNILVGVASAILVGSALLPYMNSGRLFLFGAKGAQETVELQWNIAKNARFMADDAVSVSDDSLSLADDSFSLADDCASSFGSMAVTEGGSVTTIPWSEIYPGMQKAMELGGPALLTVGALGNGVSEIVVQKFSLDAAEKRAEGADKKADALEYTAENEEIISTNKLIGEVIVKDGRRVADIVREMMEMLKDETRTASQPFA